MSDLNVYKNLQDENIIQNNLIQEENEELKVNVRVFFVDLADYRNSIQKLYEDIYF